MIAWRIPPTRNETPTRAARHTFASLMSATFDVGGARVIN